MKMLMFRIPLNQKKTRDWRKNVVRSKGREDIVMKNIRMKRMQAMIDLRNPSPIKTERNLGGYVLFPFSIRNGWFLFPLHYYLFLSKYRWHLILCSPLVLLWPRVWFYSMDLLMNRMVKADIEGTREIIEMVHIRILITRSLKTGNVVTTGQVGSFYSYTDY